MRGRFAGSLGGLTVTFLQNICRRLFDRETMGPYEVEYTIAERRVWKLDIREPHESNLYFV